MAMYSFISRIQAMHREGSMYRVGQNRTYTPYMTVYLVISLRQNLLMYTVYTYVCMV